MDDDGSNLPDGVERALEDVFAKVAGLTGCTPLETARLFISFAVMNFEAFSCGESLTKELDGAIDFIAEAKARVVGGWH